MVGVESIGVFTEQVERSVVNQHVDWSGTTEETARVDHRRPPGFLLDIEGVEEGESRFVAGPALRVGGKEIPHQDSFGCFDLRLPSSRTGV